jgi:uncharacterized metal-binding protein YceD (DUF177 family)
MNPELHRPITLGRIGPEGLEVTVEASAGECLALAERMKLVAVQRLRCQFRLEWDPSGTLIAHGHLLAEVVQTCVVSLEEFAARIEEPFTVRCVPEGNLSEDLDPDALDEITYADATLDLGDAAAEQLALALDPYPRAPGIPAVSDRLEPSEVQPFASLAALRHRH